MARANSAAAYSVTDAAVLGRTIRRIEGIEQDGMPSFDTLLVHGAVIDIPARRLYLLAAAKREPGLQGEWVCRAHARRGDAWDDPQGLVRLQISSGALSYSADAGKTFADYGLALDPPTNVAMPERMDWLAPNGGTHLGVYRLAPATGAAPAELTVALPFAPGDEFSARPSKLASGPGDRFVTFTLRPKTVGD